MTVIVTAYVAMAASMIDSRIFFPLSFLTFEISMFVPLWIIKIDDIMNDEI